MVIKPLKSALRLLRGQPAAVLCLLAAVFCLPASAQTPAQTPRASGSTQTSADADTAVVAGFQAVDGVLARTNTELEGKAQKCFTPELKELLQKWELSPAQRPAIRDRIADDLQASRAANGIDLLLLVTQEEEVISAEAKAGDGRGEALAHSRASVKYVTERFFREGKPGCGMESFPVEHFLSTGYLKPRWISNDNLCIFYALPIWLRPDAPGAVLVAGVSFQSLQKTVEAALNIGRVKLRWHVFADVKDTGPIVVAGSCIERPVRRALYQELLANGGSKEAPFDEEERLSSNWMLIKNLDQQVLGGWGVTAEPSPKLVARQAPMAAEIATLESILRHLRENWHYYAAGGGVLIAALFGIGFWRSARRSRVRRRVRPIPPIDASRPLIPPLSPPTPIPPSESLVTQFELNWKTFASYTQDLLQQKLKELEDASPVRGVKEVREQVGRLNQALDEIRSDLAAARNEVKTTTSGVAEQVAQIFDQEIRAKKPAEDESFLRKIEGDVERATSRFSQLEGTLVKLTDAVSGKQEGEIQARIKEEVEKLQVRWSEKVAEFAGEIESARRQGEALRENLQRAKDAETALQAELAQSAAREAQLRADLDVRAKELETVTEEREGAWRQERKVLEDLQAAQSQGEQKVARIRDLEQRVQQLDQAVADAAAVSRALESELTKELEVSKLEEQKLREAIKEIYREEGRFQQDLERKEKQFEADRARRAEQVETLEAQGADLQAKLRDAETETHRLRDLLQVRQDELEAFKNALDAVKEEKAHFEWDAKRVNDELETMRAERAQFDLGRLHQLEDESARLRLEVPRLQSELEKERHDIANALQALEVHKIELVDQNERGARLEEENLALQAEAAELQRSLTASDARSQELLPAKEALEKALQSSLAEVKRLRESADARAAEQRAARDAGLADARTDSDRLEKLVREQEKKLKSAEEERLRSKTQATQLEAQWRARHGELEQKAVEAQRKQSDAERRLQDAEASARSLGAQLESAQKSPAASDAAVDRLRSLEKERHELMEVVDKLGKELEKLRTEADGIRRFQGTLVDASIPMAIVAFDGKLKIFAWNSRAEKLWGRSSAATLGRLLSDLGTRAIDRELTTLANRALSECRTAGLPQSSFTDEDGKVHHVRLSCDPILGPRNEVLGGVLVAEEITETVEREIEGRLQALFNQSLTRSLPGALVVMDTQNRVISWNRSAESLLGISEKDALGESFFDLSTPLSKEAFRRHFDETRRGKKPARVKVRFEQQGVPTQFIVTQTPFLGGDDAVRGTILLMQEAAELVEARK